jgi:hypothetical protein
MNQSLTQIVLLEKTTKIFRFQRYLNIFRGRLYLITKRKLKNY